MLTCLKFLVELRVLLDRIVERLILARVVIRPLVAEHEVLGRAHAPLRVVDLAVVHLGFKFKQKTKCKSGLPKR